MILREGRRESLKWLGTAGTKKKKKETNEKETTCKIFKEGRRESLRWLGTAGTKKRKKKKKIRKKPPV